jgi:glycosyltransferase involved in cell wall biosynthesis
MSAGDPIADSLALSGDAAAADLPMPRVLFISGVGGVARRCRVTQPMEQLALAGIPATFRLSGDVGFLGDALEHDIVILHRVAMTPYIDDLLEVVHERGRVSLYDADDLVFRPDLIDHDSYYRHLPPGERRIHEDHVLAQRATMLRCDYGLTTTEYLADLLAAEGKEVLINRNALSGDWVQWCGQAEGEVAKRGRQVVLGYVSGSKSHDFDFAELADGLATVMGRHSNVVLRVVGHLGLTPTLAPFRDRIEMVDFMPWSRVPWELAGLDINLAPLEQDNPYCNAKSELKYIEASVLGLPTIASKTQCYQHAIRHGENGLLAGNPDEWASALESAVTDEPARVALGEAARADVLANYLPAVRSRQFATQLLALWQRHQGAVDPATDLPAMWTVIDRLVEHLAEDDDWVGEDADTLERGAARRKAVQHRHILRLEDGLRREHRTPVARLTDRAKFTLKRFTGRNYATRFDGQSVAVLPPLLAGQRYEQRFTADEDGLCGLDLLVSTFQRVATSLVLFELWPEVPGEVPLATDEVRGTAFNDTALFTFGFERLSDSAGKTYRAVFSSPDGDWGDAVAFWQVVDDARKAGAEPVRIDGVAQRGELAGRRRYCAAQTK